MALYVDGVQVETFGTIYGGLPYLRIGDAATTAESLNSEDDLLVTGELEVTGVVFFRSSVNVRNGVLLLANDIDMAQGNAFDSRTTYETADPDAKVVVNTIDESDDSGNNVPAWVYGEETNIFNVDLGLLDEVVQPHGVYIENAGKYTSSTSGTHDGTDLDELTETGKFTNSVIGDVLRIVSGTNVTAGWYWITDVTNNDNVNLDRNFVTGGAASDVVYVAFHGLGMITPRAFYLPIYDGAPSDSDIDINMDGAIALDVGSGTGLLYARMQSNWRHFTPDGGDPTFNDVTVDKLKYGAEVDLTIAGGVVAVTKTYHSIITQGGADDQLDTATGGSEGDILILKSNLSATNGIVTVANATGADAFILAGGANFVLDHIDDRLMLIHNGTEWVEISRSANS